MAYKLHDSVIMDYVGENLIISCKNGDLVLMGNTTTGIILDCIQKKMTHCQIVDAICREYEVNIDEVDTDIRNIYNMCVDNEILVICPNTKS